MTVISLGKNISSLKAQRQLNDTSASLARTYERLASGQRINHASDDAAGLAISSKLNAHARVYGQALRNANDGISALNIAEGAVTQLSDILIRIKELAESAGNGTLALTQRRSLDSEAKALTEEYNRILSTTKFNKNKLIDGSMTELGIQLGFGGSGRLSFGVGSGLERTVGTGSFTGGGGGTLSSIDDVYSADLNEDGIDDIIRADADPDQIVIMIGDGNGGFSSGDILFADIDAPNVVVGDVNGDGHVDIIAQGMDTDIGADYEVRVALGNGDGTFKSHITYTTPEILDTVRMALGDLNGDGSLDILAGGTTSPVVMLNNGDGSFGAAHGYSIAASTYGLRLGDLNNDGNLDIIGASSFLQGNGDGTFGAQVTIAASSSLRALEDFNQDGILDVLTRFSADSSLHLLLGNGDGTFTDFANLGTRANPSLVVGDFNIDGHADILTYQNNSIQTLLGNGDGTFGAAISTATPLSGSIGTLVGDFNGDGVPDMWNPAGATGGAFLSDTTTTNETQRFNLTTREAALQTLDLLNDSISRVSKELGNIGAAQSRLQSAVNTISQTRENYYAAYSRIVDVDVADETSKLLVNQIRQQAAASIMAQANQTPALALVLLGR